MNYKINFENWEQVFAVPKCVTDRFLKLASGHAVKVLLYILANNSSGINVKKIAEATGILEEFVDDALCFWEQVEVLKRTDSPPKIAEISPEVSPALPKIQPAETLTEPPKPSTRQTLSTYISPKELAERINNSEEIKFLFSTAEGLLGNVLTNTEQRSLIWCHDYLGLPTDVLTMLMDYCKSIDKTNMKFMETIAISWQEKGIMSHESADEEIQVLKEQHTLASKVRSLFGIGSRNLSSKEGAFVLDWAKNGYSSDLISYAYDKTIDAIGKVSFSYINTILHKWQEKGLLSREQIDNDNKFSKGKKANDSKSHSYNLDEIDQFALNFTPKVHDDLETKEEAAIK
ncbi:MAG: DnaD domain protein [Oscillospiraceae bacterium]